MKTLALLLLLPSVVFAESVAEAADPHWLAKLLVANVLPMVITILTPLLLAALAYLTSLLKAKAAESHAAKVGLIFTEATNSVVAELNATLKPKLLEALADGKLTDAEKTQLKEAALTALKTKLPASLLGSAQGLFGGFVDSWLGGLIERAVISQKPVIEPVAPSAPIIDPLPLPR